ncbi:cytochrome b [Thalassococcus sp. S3]|uniref:cytochrome b n=1 Tax=Thalassococcus sp. S3 TaxID=2017482 RepID=UPI00210FF9D6|nr:cytochrome b/b6 domain-containing protein [Thalassococcus sp. S3]
MSISAQGCSDRHGLAMRLLHWLTVVLVLIQLVLAGLNAWLYEPRPILAEALVQAHISLGAILFVLTIARIAVRTFGYRAPPSASRWRVVAEAVQLVLYICLFMLPISGYIRLAALGFPIELFGTVTLPTMLPTPELALRAAAVHNAIARILIGAILIHFAGALFHRRLTGEDIAHRIGFGSRT